MRQKEPGERRSLFFKAFDLEDASSIPGLVKELRKEFGSIHGLVNNAGLGTSSILGTMHDSQIERLVRLNTVSPIRIDQVCVAIDDGRQLRANRKCRLDRRLHRL